jgi:hypothetical protein
MPFSPRDFEWYTWLGFAILAAIICRFGWVILINATDSKNTGGGIILLLAAGIAGIFSLLIGIIRFVKWAWGS